METGRRGEGATEDTPDHKTPQKSPQGEKTAVQKQTFTRWMNVFLKRCDPPVEVQDLFLDVQDGKALMALLEELSGCKLVYRFRPSSHRIFRLNNVAKALAFLDDRHVKLLGIDASSVADGVPHVVLKLIWNIISFFQIKEATGGLQRRLSSSLSSLSTSSYPASRDLSPSPGDPASYSSCTLPSKRRRPAGEPRLRWKPMKTFLLWVQRRTSSLGVEVRDFGRSWRSGLAFLALIKSIDPGLVDLRDGLAREPQQNLEEAFRIAQDSLGIPALLEPQDVACTSPDERSVVTYLSMFLEYHSDADEGIAPDVAVRPQVPEIPDYTPAEPGGFGKTLAAQPEALRHSLCETSEQLLWKRWSRRSSGEPRPDLHPPRRRTSPLQRTTADAAFSPRSNETGIPQSGLSSGPANDEADRRDNVLSWMDEASGDHHVFRSSRLDFCADEDNFSQSSEEGLCRLSALDSDEEDAYSYILDLQRDHRRSDPPAKARHPVPGPPEGTTDRGRRRRTSERRPKGEPKPSSASRASGGAGPDHRRTLCPQNPPSQNGTAEKQAGGAMSETRVKEGESVLEQMKEVEKTDDAEDEERKAGGNALKEETRVTGSEVTLEAARGEEDHEGHRVKRRAGPRDELDEEKGGDERYKVNATERLADDGVFKEGSVRVTEEVSEFRGRLAYGVRSSNTSERSPGHFSDESDGGDETAEISEDTGPVKHGEGEIKARVYEGVMDERKAEATDEKHVGMLLERKAERKATKLYLEDDLKRAHRVEGAFILKSSSFKRENQEVCNNQAAHDAIKSLQSENSQNNPTTDTTTHIQGDPNEREQNKTHLCKRLEGDKDGRSDRERINAKLHGSLACAEQKDVVGVSLERYEEDTMESNQTPVCRASSLHVSSEKGAAASSCDITGPELEVLFGLWMLLFCYFLFSQIHL